MQSKPEKVEAPDPATVRAALEQLGEEDRRRWRERLLAQPHLRMALAALLADLPTDRVRDDLASVHDHLDHRDAGD